MKLLIAWLHRSPVVKTALTTALGGAAGAVVPLVSAGNTNLAAIVAAAKSGAVTALVAAIVLWVKRPSDATAADKGEVK